MKALPLTALALALTTGLSAPALAQDSGSRIEPYVGVMGGLHDFDNNDNFKDAPPYRGSGGLVEGVAGVNYNMGRFFIGAEGQVAKGVEGDLDWEYGGSGRFGFKAGKDSIFFGKVGYLFSTFSHPANPGTYEGMLYGAGAEVSLADLGGSAETSNIRLRFQGETRGQFRSFRPMMGIVAKF